MQADSCVLLTSQYHWCIQRKIVQTKYDVPVRKAHKGNHICLHDFSFYLRSE